MSSPVKHAMKFRVVTMTPTWAAELLKNNHPSNRGKKWGRVTAYASDMENGYWKLTHQPIAVDLDGHLVDGQNRLEAVIMSGRNVPMVMVTGCPRDSILGADIGAIRNVGDMAKILGKPLPHGATMYAAVARAMEAGLQGNTAIRMTNADTLEFIKVHNNALEFAFECLPKNIKGITHAAVRGVIARAYYSKSKHKRTNEFCQVLASGLVNEPKADSGAIRLRNWLINTFLGGRHGSPRRASGLIVYAKTERALTAFHNNEEVKSLIEMNKELFPIVGDSKPEED